MPCALPYLGGVPVVAMPKEDAEREPKWKHHQLGRAIKYGQALRGRLDLGCC